MTISILLILGVWQIVVTGYFNRWRDLPSPPQRFTELFTIIGGIICGKTADGENYRCTEDNGECWVRDQAAESCVNKALYRFAGFEKPCNFW